MGAHVERACSSVLFRVFLGKTVIFKGYQNIAKVKERAKRVYFNGPKAEFASATMSLKH